MPAQTEKPLPPSLYAETAIPSLDLDWLTTRHGPTAWLDQQGDPFRSDLPRSIVGETLVGQCSLGPTRKQEGGATFLIGHEAGCHVDHSPSKSKRSVCWRPF